MEDSKDTRKVTLDLDKTELYIIVQALGNSTPNVDLETIQFRLYHKLKFKLNELK